MDDNKDDVKHMIPEDDVINLHDLLAHSAPTRSPEEFERSTEDVELEADEKKVPVLGEEFISHHDVVASSSSKRHTEVKINEEGTYRYVVGRPNMSGPSTSSNYYGQIVNNVNTGQRIDPALRGNSHHTVSRCASSSSTAGRSQAPPTFYCTLCRSNIPSAIYQLVVPSDLVPKEALRQLLLTKYGSSVVDEALKGDHPVLICRRHVENETESASSTFFCTLCRSHIPSSVNQLIVTPGVKPNLRRILQNKFSACQVEEALKGEEQLLICRRHVEEEIDPTTPTFFCVLCRDHVPGSVQQLVVTPDPVCKETIRELLLKKYRELRMVQDALVGNASVVICRHHVELDPNEVARRQNEPLLPKNDDKELARRRSRDCMRRLRWMAAKENTVNGGEEEVKPRRGRKRKCRQSYEDDCEQPTLPTESSEEIQERRLQEERKLIIREKARLRLQREDAHQRAERLASAAESQRIRRMHMGEAGRQEYKEYFRRWKERMTDQQRAEYTERRRLQRQRRMMNETDQQKEKRLERARENMRNKARQREDARLAASSRECEDHLPEQRSEPATAL